MDAAAYFSTSVPEASARFRAAAAARGFGVQVYPHSGHGPRKEPLETLVCQFGPDDSEHVLVLNSGTHGTEAFVGAGVLMGLLANAEDFLALAPRTRFVLIHIINPYGAAWGRYVNEDNVDLMKNLTYGDMVAPTDPLFEPFDDLIDLASLHDADAVVERAARRKDFLAAHGADRIMRALKKGQSARPNSICYNGVAATWSKRTLDAILKDVLADCGNAVFIDLHSGVGAWGEAYVMAAGDETSKARIRGWLGDTAHEIDLPMTPPALSTLSAFAPPGGFAAAIIEGGTVTFDDAFREIMWLEMYHHLYGDPLSAEALANKAKFAAYYDPRSDEWRRVFWENISAVLKTVAVNLEAWPAAKVTP